MSDQAVVRDALKELVAWRLRANVDPQECMPKVRAEEAALNRLCALLLNIEGTLLGSWTDIPQSEIQRLLPRIRESLGDYENWPGQPR